MTAEQNGFAYGGYDWNGIVVNCLNERVHSVWKDFNAELPTVQEDLLEKCRIFQGQLYIYREEAPLFGTILDDYITNWSHDCLLNLIHKSAGKDKAINWCLDRYHIQKCDSYAFGDGYNDIEMFEAVGHRIAVEDAFEPLKQIADFITSAPDNDGIANGLKHYGFI